MFVKIVEFSKSRPLLREWPPGNSLDRYVYRGELHGVGKGAELMKIMEICDFNGIMLFLHTFRARLLSLYEHNDLGSFSGDENQEFAKFHNFNQISGKSRKFVIFMILTKPAPPKAPQIVTSIEGNCTGATLSQELHKIDKLTGLHGLSKFVQVSEIHEIHCKSPL